MSFQKIIDQNYSTFRKGWTAKSLYKDKPKYCLLKKVCEWLYFISSTFEFLVFNLRIKGSIDFWNTKTTYLV